MEKPLIGKNILIVEDEPVFRSLLVSLLTGLGASTFEAGDGLDGLEKFSRCVQSVTSDLIICDLAMPRMGGIEFVEHLRLHVVIACPSW